jgi:hypothetical protein
MRGRAICSAFSAISAATSKAMPERLLSAIGDRRNVAGLLGAGVGLGLTFGGLVDAGWWAITGGLYAAGFLASQILMPPKAVTVDGGQARSTDELIGDLRALAKQIGPQLPDQAQLHLTSLLAAVSGIAPKLRVLDPATPSLIAIRQCLADYIPTTLQAYAALPPRVRSAAALSDGRTAEAQITTQLALLGQQVDKMADTISRGDLEALEVQGRFLDEKFRTPDLFAD